MYIVLIDITPTAQSLPGKRSKPSGKTTRTTCSMSHRIEFAEPKIVKGRLNW